MIGDRTDVIDPLADPDFTVQIFLNPVALLSVELVAVVGNIWRA